MTPDSIILLTPDARLDALIYALSQARQRAIAQQTEEAWDARVAAWEALHAELMSQLAGASNAVTAKCLGLAKVSEPIVDI